MTSPKKGAGIVIHPFDACKSQDLNNPCVANFLQKFRLLGISWLYNWGVGRPGWIDNNVEYVPMVGGPGTGPNKSYTQAELKGFSDYAKNNPGSYWLIWNEPDYWLQANIAAEIAANIYKPLRDAIISADPKAKFIVGGFREMDTNWGTKFRDTYKQINGVYPPLDGWAFHHYSSDYNLAFWRNLVGGIRKWLVANGDADKEFWFSEYGCLSSNEMGLQIMKDQQEWLEAPAQSWITRYAWFYLGVEGASGTQQGNLFTGDLSLSRLDLSELGKEYAKHPINSTPTPLTTSTPTPTVTPTLTPTPIPCPKGDLGNLDCDSAGLINAFDLAILLNSWAPNGSVSSSDISGPNGAADGKVDNYDLNFLLGNWKSN